MITVNFKARMKTPGFKSSALYTETRIWLRGCTQAYRSLMYSFWKTMF